MNIHRLADAGIRNLGRLFVPAGLPLVSKTGAEPATTSILVRGGPGTGKTTMSVAMAHAIASENAGAVLFLTTEFSPAEVVVKANLLGLPEGSVIAWEGRASAQRGSILVQHLAATPLAEPADVLPTSTDQKRLAMEAIWTMLRELAPSPVPVRAVVIDAFGLSDTGEVERGLRGDLVPFIQALEKQGISTVLVEEAIPGGPDWLAFVTDVVFEISFQADADNGELHRKVVCRKSRYAQAVPGPHDYGLDLGHRRPSIFPDPLLGWAARSPSGVSLPKERRPAIFIPLDEETAVTLRNGALVLNAFDQAGTRMTNAVGATPGLVPLTWEWGPLTKFQIGKLRGVLHESAGPYAACEAMLDVLERAGGNAVEMHNVGSHALSSRYRSALPRVLEALRSRGLLVLLHGESQDLAPFRALADLDSGSLARGIIRTSLTRHYCPVTIHLPSLDTLRMLLGTGQFEALPSEGEGSLIRHIHDAVRAAYAAHTIPEADQVLRSLNITWDGSVFDLFSPRLTAAYFLLALARRKLGSRSDPIDDYLGARMPGFGEEEGRDVLSAPVEAFSANSPLHAQLAWTYALQGEMSRAAQYCYLALEEDAGPRATINHLLWIALQAVYAASEQALSQLLQYLANEPVDSLLIGFALNALVAQKRTEEIDEVVDRYVQRSPLPSYIERRLRLEPLLRPRDAALRERARLGLVALLDAPDIPALHRAEILHNAAYANEMLGKADVARELYSKACETNPHLTLAAEALARFDRPEALGANAGESPGPDDDDALSPETEADSPE